MSSGFVTESEIAEARKKRQEEWEKVRQPDQPLERPEEPYDGRSLYDRLKEQKLKKDLEYEEAHKLKNLIRGLHDDEIQFLEQVGQTKLAAEQRQMKEEEQELRDFRNKVSTLQEESIDKIIQKELKKNIKAKARNSGNPSTARMSQKSLLVAGIKRKADPRVKEISEASALPANDVLPRPYLHSIRTNGDLDCGSFQCVAILPGIGPYTESSDSEISSGSEDEPGEQVNQFNLLGVKQKKKKKCQDGE